MRALDTRCGTVPAHALRPETPKAPLLQFSERVRRLLSVMSGFALAFGFASSAAAQETPFPGKGTIEITVLFPAGSSADITARLLAEGMAKRLDTTVIVVDRPGAGGAIGYKYVAHQKPNGYSLVWNSNSISTTHYAGQLDLDYRAFDPVARVLVESPVVAVRKEAKWKTLSELMTDAKSSPEAITIGNSGMGSHTHISSVALSTAAGAKVLDVPFSTSQVIPSLLGGQVDAIVQLPAVLGPYVQSGAIRILATLTSARDPAFPDVPTAREQGYDVALDAWRGIAVPKGTPPAVIAKLEEAIRETVASPEFVSAAEKFRIRPAFLPAAQFGRLIEHEDAELAKIMQLIGLKQK